MVLNQIQLKKNKNKNIKHQSVGTSIIIRIIMLAWKLLI